MAAFNSWLTEVQSTTTRLNDAFWNDRKNTPKRSRAEGCDAAPTDAPPFNEVQCSWLQSSVGGAVTAALSSFGQSVDERFKHNEKAIHAIQQVQTDIKERLTVLEALPAASQSDPTLQAEIQDLRAKVEAVSTPCQANALPHSGQGRSPVNDYVPHELRKHAVIGNLGWDDDEGTIEARAKELLQAAGVPDSDYTNLYAVRAKGSMVELWFNDPDLLQKARLTIRRLGRSFPGARKSAWLDVKKTREQLKPNRMVHRIATFLEDVERNKDQPATITKDMKDKAVNRNNIQSGKVVFGKWRWSPEGLQDYSQTARENAVEWASLE